jgi:ATP-dependent Clp protease ATP-binding subunit ClpX
MNIIQKVIREIKAELDEKVFKQDEAKNALSYALGLHLFKTKMPEEHNRQIKKTNVLLMGPTGVGKTLLASQLKGIGFDVFKMSARDITDEGIAGLSISDYLKMFLNELEGDIDRLEKSIIFVDEFDKITGPYALKGGGDHNRITQELLLKFIEGHEYRVNLKGGVVDTKNIMFVICGNFEAVRQRRKAAEKPTMGFVDNSEISLKPIHEELQDIGLMAELAGRISLVAELESLTKDDLMSILLTVDDNILDQYKALFNSVEVELPLTKEDLETIVEGCVKNKTGARGLQTELDKLLYRRLL